MLFPEPKGDPLQLDEALQQALEGAIAASPEPPWEAPIAIVALSPNGPPHPFAEQRGLEVHYSSSVLKVAAMYAAFELGRAAHALIDARGLTAADAIPTLHEFDNEIRDTKLPQLDAGLDEQYLLPKYDQIFQFDPAISNVNFSPSYWSHLEGAIVNASNEHASNCVHGIGFGYLTRVMAEAGFLASDLTEEPASANGIWLGGDFGFGYPAQRIPSVNDGAVAQGMSARQMARLFTLLQEGKLMPRPSGEEDKPPLKPNTDMQKMLELAVGKGNYLLTKGTSVGYETLQSKMGYGPLKSGAVVASEALVVKERSTTRQFVVVFQNVKYNENPASLAPIAQIIDQTIAAFQ
jgi:hypothetical protein